MLIGGLKVIESTLCSNVPVLQLASNFTACTDAVRSEMNRWLLEMFGTRDTAYLVGGNTLITSPALAAKMRAEVKHDH